MNYIKNGIAYIDQFLGLQKNLTGDTNIKLGELSEMMNVRLTPDYKAKKCDGYIQLFASLGHPIRGQWQGYINGIFFHLFACNGHLYKTIAGINTDLGSLSDAPTNFFLFEGNLYIQDGTEYRKFDGTTLSVVSGYIPLVAIGTPPIGGGTNFELVNVLINKKRQSFRSDGVNTEYVTRWQNITSINSVKLNGVTKTLGVDYTQNLVTGKITFVALQPNNTTPFDDIEIEVTEGTASRSEITNNTQSMFFGGKNDFRVFLYGNGTNVAVYSELANRLPSAEYFTGFSFSTAGTSEHPITSILKQYDRQIIHTSLGSYYSVYEFDLDLGATFPVYPLNDKIGNIPLGQGQVIENNPFTITHGVWEWLATNVRDERNAQFKSERVQSDLDELDLSTAITYDYEEYKEYWLCVGNRVWVYNYRIDAWYYFELYDTPTSFITINGELYFGTANGQIMRFAKGYRSFNGHSVQTKLHLGFMDFGTTSQKKYINKTVWITFLPAAKSTTSVKWQIDNDEEVIESLTEVYDLLDYGAIDYEDWSYLTYYTPQPQLLKIKAKGFVYYKMMFEDNSIDKTFTLLSIKINVTYGGNVK